MKNNSSMEEVSVQELICKYNLIVPEIQREYVWGNNDFGILDTFINDIKEGFSKEYSSQSLEEESFEEILNKLDPQLKGKLEDLIQQSTLKSSNIKNSCNINIGFIYSYRPDYYVFNDRSEDVYLIDGQQRFTSLFLILFYLAVKENKTEEFEALFRIGQIGGQGHIAFDYRVRTITHDFLIDLVSKVKSVEDIKNISEKTWFLSNYKNDVTIKSIVGDLGKGNGAFSIIHRHFKDETNTFFDFVKSNVKFWHFKTEETSQGEELYITMNSRGQQLADNETIRAGLFEGLSSADQLKWSEKWELWQDFFWKNRYKKDGKSNADSGFNEFLRWVQIINIFKSQSDISTSDNEDATDKKELVQIIKNEALSKKNNSISLETIDLYFKSLKFIYEDYKLKVEEIKSHYSGYSNFYWFESNWLSGSNFLDKKDIFRLLPIILYCSKAIENNEEPNVLNTFRLARFFHNVIQSEKVEKSVSPQIVNALAFVELLPINADILVILEHEEKVSKVLLDREEVIKLTRIRDAESRFYLEELFWNAEDFYCNNGKIKHLLDYTMLVCEDNTPIVFIDTLKKTSEIYKEIIQNLEICWGDLLPTSTYYELEDRVLYNETDWHSSKGIMKLVDERYDNPNYSFSDFLTALRKEFIKTYYNIQELLEEESLKKQLYIYYIIHTELLKEDWNWGEEFDYCNFGAYNTDEINVDLHSIFYSKIFFQVYRKQWKKSMGYRSSYGIELQYDYDENENYFEQLINWANS